MKDKHELRLAEALRDDTLAMLVAATLPMKRKDRKKAKDIALEISEEDRVPMSEDDVRQAIVRLSRMGLSAHISEALGWCKCDWTYWQASVVDVVFSEWYFAQRVRA